MKIVMTCSKVTAKVSSRWDKDGNKYTGAIAADVALGWGASPQKDTGGYYSSAHLQLNTLPPEMAQMFGAGEKFTVTIERATEEPQP